MIPTAADLFRRGEGIIQDHLNDQNELPMTVALLNARHEIEVLVFPNSPGREVAFAVRLAAVSHSAVALLLIDGVWSAKLTPADEPWFTRSKQQGFEVRHLPPQLRQDKWMAYVEHPEAQATIRIYGTDAAGQLVREQEHEVFVEGRGEFRTHLYPLLPGNVLREVARGKRAGRL